MLGGGWRWWYAVAFWFYLRGGFPVVVDLRVLLFGSLEVHDGFPNDIQADGVCCCGGGWDGAYGSDCGDS